MAFSGNPVPGITKQVTNVSATLTYEGTDYPLGSFDSLTITKAETMTVEFPSDGSGAGVAGRSGGENPDIWEFVTTYLAYDFSDLLQTIYRSGSLTRCEISVIENENPERSYLLEFARPTSTLYQNLVDNERREKYNPSFHGRMTVINDGNLNYV